MIGSFSSDFSSIYAQLTSFAKLENFWSLFDTAFGSSYDFATAASFRSQWQSQDFSLFPQIEIVNSDVLGSAKGAYAISTNRIYLSDQFVSVASQQSLDAVILEEFGHFVDAQVNATDTPGDEGEWFSVIVRGVNLSLPELKRIEAEDDHTNIVINNQSIQIEQATSTPSTDDRINALLGGYKWGITTITYSFFAGDSYYGYEFGLAPVSNAIKTSVRNFLTNAIEPLINVHFVEVSDSSSSYGQIRYLLSSDPDYAYAYYPDSTDTNQGDYSDVAGDVVLNSSYDNNYDSDGFQGGLGTHGYLALIHETLHALGLKHPGDYNGGGVGEPPFLPFDQDNQDNTVMTYNFTDAEPATPMPYDVLALQYLYGAKAYNASNTTYRFSLNYSRRK